MTSETRSGFCRVARGRVAARMHRDEERHDRVDFGGAQVLAVGRHVAAALYYLADDLVAGQASCGGVEGGAAESAFAAERVAVATLLALGEGSALQFEGTAALDVIDWGCRAAPCVHHG